MTPPISTLALWRSLRRLLGLGLLLAGLVLVTGAAVVVQAGRSDGGSADAALVMIDDTGAQPRVDRARQLYSEGKVSRILLAGADPTATLEALKSRGVKEEALIALADPSQIGQVTSARATLEQEHLASALLIAEPVETLRLLKIAHDADLRLQSTPVGARADISIKGIVVEVGRYFRYVLLGR